MKKVLVLIAMILMMTTPAFALSQNICVDDDTLFCNKTVSVNMDGNTSIINVEKNTTCINGCSYTMGACRYDIFWEIIALVLVISLLVGMIHYSTEISVLNMTMIVLGSIASVIVASTDVFSWPLRTLFLILPIAISVYAIRLYLSKRKEESGYSD